MKKTIVLLGATGTLGKALSLELSELGYHLILVGRHHHKLENLATMVQGSPVLVPASLTTLVQIDELVVKLATHYPPMDGLISCLGHGSPLGPIDTVTEKEWTKTIHVNVTLNWKILQAFTPFMNQNARMVFPLEAHWLEPCAYASVYGFSKKMLFSLIEQYNLDHAIHSIKAKIVSLPLAQSPLTSNMFPGLQETLTPPQELAKTIVKQLLF